MLNEKKQKQTNLAISSDRNVLFIFVNLVSKTHTILNITILLSIKTISRKVKSKVKSHFRKPEPFFSSFSTDRFHN